MSNKAKSDDLICSVCEKSIVPFLDDHGAWAYRCFGHKEGSKYAIHPLCISEEQLWEYLSTLWGELAIIKVGGLI